MVHDPRARASYAIHESPPPLDSSRSLYTVYGDCNQLFVVASLARALAFLAGQLAELDPVLRQQAGTLRLDAAALIGAKAAVLVPWWLPYKEPRVELRLGKYGIRLLESPSVTVDPHTRELVVRSRELIRPEEVGATSSITAQARSELTSPGRWPVAAWIFLGEDERWPELTRAQALARALGTLYGDGRPREGFRGLAELIRHVNIMRCTRREAVPAVRSVLI